MYFFDDLIFDKNLILIIYRLIIKFDYMVWYLNILIIDYIG